MKVLLVYPNLHGMNMLPPAIGIFTGLLKNQGYEVRLFDTTNWIVPGEEGFDSDKLKEQNLNARPYDDSVLMSEIRATDVFQDFRYFVQDYAPNLIAVSSTEDMFPLGVRLLQGVKDLSIPKLWGGVFPTFAPELCLSYDEVDMVCIGEGEGALLDLCQRLTCGQDYADIQNIWVKRDGKIIRNPMRAVTDINQNPLVDFSLFDESRYYRPMQGKVWRMLPVETHRGCPFSCTFCNSPAQRQLYRTNTGCHFFRKKSLEAIRDEVMYYKNELKADSLYFWADMFMAYSDKELEEFLEMYQDINLPFWCQVRPEAVREGQIRKLMKAGLFRVGIGIEHGNEDFRRNVLKRRMSNATIIENLAILNKLDLPFSVNNIIGFPTETRALAMDTVELNRALNADSHNAYSFTPFHGTPLRLLSEELGYIAPGQIVTSATKPTLLNMPQFPKEEIEGLRRCFVLYVKMPKERWNDIRLAEANTEAGNRIFEELKEECREKYLLNWQ
ncbi:MAG: B12-binding domain-containing radical SAM protein [Solirubrobacterales bacterium]